MSTLAGAGGVSAIEAKYCKSSSENILNSRMIFHLPQLLTYRMFNYSVGAFEVQVYTNSPEKVTRCGVVAESVGV